MTTFDVTSDVDLDQLGAEIAAAHGWPDPPGLLLDGTRLRVLRDGADSGKVRDVLVAHTPPPPAGSLAERLAAVEARLDKAANAAVTGDAAKLRDNLKPVP